MLMAAWVNLDVDVWEQYIYTHCFMFETWDLHATYLA